MMYFQHSLSLHLIYRGISVMYIFSVTKNVNGHPMGVPILVTREELIARMGGDETAPDRFTKVA